MSRFFTNYIGESKQSSSVAPRIELSGDVHGAGNLPYVVARLNESGVIPGVYPRVEVNSKGIIVRGLTAIDTGQAGNFAIRKYNFEAPALSWLIKHDMGTTSFTTTIFNTLNERVYANERVVDSDSFIIEFTEETAGSVSVVLNLM